MGLVICDDCLKRMEQKRMEQTCEMCGKKTDYHGRELLERELKKAKIELFTATSLKDMKLVQKKIAFLQSKLRDGV